MMEKEYLGNAILEGSIYATLCRSR